MHLGLFISTPCISDGSVFLYFPLCITLLYFQMLVESEDEKWIYTKFIHSDSLPMCCFCFLEGHLCMHCLCIPSVLYAYRGVYERRLFSPDVCLFLLVSYTKIVVAWAEIHLRKCSLIKGHTPN